MFSPESYTIIAYLFPRLLGLIYFFALGALLLQVRGLIGKNGILPLSQYLQLMRGSFYNKSKLYFNTPSVFWFNSSDLALMGVLGAGVAISILLILGFVPSLLLLLLYIIHLSIKTAGQDFLSFGWEAFLLEITAQAFFMSLTSIPNIMIWISINFLLFRFHLQAGFIKLQSQDPNWRNLTATAYHYQTQPIPNTIAWYFHKLPLAFHKFSTALTLGIELVVPFGIFLTDTIRFGVFCCFFFLQFMIWFTGNFSYLNHLSAVFSTLLISNKFLSTFISPQSIPVVNESYILDIILSGVGAIFILLQIVRLWHQFAPSRRLNAILNCVSPFCLANRYTIFARMTTERFEVVVEGSEDGITWKEYLFKYKPSELSRRPRRCSPYQPRLDWQIWFLPFRDYYEENWFQQFLYHLLMGTPEVISLLRHNPFPTHPPKFVRSHLYEYEFSSFQEKKHFGTWWKRTLINSYSPTMSLKKQNTNS